MEPPPLDLDGLDSFLHATPHTMSKSEETFEEELLRDAHLPKDGGP